MSQSDDPQFVSATDLHINPSALRLLASPVDGAGTPIPGITDDFDGDSRNATTPDIGADEIGSPSRRPWPPSARRAVRTG